jgi:hypothetical protein
MDLTGYELNVLRNLVSTLEYLRDVGFQPMYNGRPSCPFCQHFVDDEEEHHESCVLVTSLSILARELKGAW